MKRSGIAVLIVSILIVAVVVYVFFSLPGKTPADHFGHITSYTLDHTLDPENHALRSRIDMTWVPSDVDTLTFLLHRGLMIDMVRADDAALGELRLLAEGGEVAPMLTAWSDDEVEPEETEHLAVYEIPLTAESDTILVHLEVSGEIFDDIEVASFSRWEIADETSGLIDNRGAFLTPWTGYYPVLPGESKLSTFSTTLHLPDTWEGLVEGDIVLRSGDAIEFSSVDVLDGSYLVAGPYEMRSVMAGDVEIAMYYYPDSAPLVDKYLRFSSIYMDDYQQLIGDYPFARFSVVENFFPTGYGMPSYTLLGSQVLALPFIPFTSLPHEIAHNWWGNGCFVDYKSGNWCEGLTTYSADYRLKKESSPEEAMQYRLDVMRDYSDYVVRGDEEDFALREFTSRTTAGTRTIGYGKSMMVFHMLATKYGDETFWKVMRTLYGERKFTIVSWDDIFDYFENETGDNLNSFKRQWIDRVGAPDLALQNVQLFRDSSPGKSRIELDIKQLQGSPDYDLDIPVSVRLANDSLFTMVLHDVHGTMYHARVEVPGTPVDISVDPGFDLFRVLDPLEAPATLAAFYGEEAPVVVLPQTGPMVDAYRSFAESFFRRGNAELVNRSEYDDGDFSDRSVMFLGGGAATRKAIEEMEAGSDLDVEATGFAVIAAVRDVENSQVVHVEVKAQSADALQAIIRKLPHYGKYSYLAFMAGQNVGKGQWKAENSPMTYKFSE